MKKPLPRRTHANATRNTLPKAIAAAYKSGDKNKAMDLAVFGREKNALTDLARDLVFFVRVQQNPDLKKVAMSSGGERLGSFEKAPRRQSLQQRSQNLKRWLICEQKKLAMQIQTGVVWYGKNFLADLALEFECVCNKDANVKLFSQFGSTGSPQNNPNWFRQILIANLGIVSTVTWNKKSESLTAWKPQPLAQIAKEFNLPHLKNLRDIERKMGMKPRRKGRPKS